MTIPRFLYGMVAMLAAAPCVWAQSEQETRGELPVQAEPPADVDTEQAEPLPDEWEISPGVLQDEAVVQMKARRVALFKNGYACVLMQGVLPLKAVAEVRGMPLPVLGTVDWGTPPGVELQRVVAGMSHSRRPAGLGGWVGLCREYTGCEVAITTTDGHEHRGRIVSPMRRPELPQAAFVKADAPLRAAADDVPHDAVVVLRTARGALVSVVSSRIQSVDTAEAESTPRPAPPTPEMSLELERPAPGHPIMARCIAYGLSWLPLYHLELREDGTARMVGRVVVMNEMMDLENVQLELITGTPPLGEALVTSPLVRMVSLRELLTAIQTNRDWLPGVMQAMRRYARVVDADDVDITFGEISGGAGANGFGGSAPEAGALRMRRAGAIPADWSILESTAQAEDLFYYSIPEFSCARGDTVERDLFELVVPYEHVYICTVPNQSNLQRREADAPLDVWHCVRLTNVGDLPWSSGIAACYAGGRPVARTTMNYVDAGHEGLVEINKTPEATVVCREEQTRRGSASNERRRGTPDVYKGVLTVRNLSARTMELELVKQVTGTPGEVSDAATVSVMPGYGANPSSTVCWKLKLAPGEEKKCSYTYSYAN